MLAAGSLALVCGCSTPQPETPASKEEPVTLQVDASKVIAPIQPTMYGIFFEDINFAADGGIYAEMVKNRSFEFEIPDIGWTQPASDRFSMNEKTGFASIMEEQNQAPNAHFIQVTNKSDKGYCLTNGGFRGMGVKEGLEYHFSMKARLQEGFSKIRIELASSAGTTLAESSIEISGSDWKEYTATLTARATELKAVLNLWFEGKGVTDVDMVSLFPSDTWKNRPKGLRGDLVQLLADLQPGFLRFPGGCIVEGRTLDRRYQWKKTVRAIEDREVLVNRWNTEFGHRPTPDYYQSFGLGFFEYFQLAEDLGAEPLPILSCGMACQFNTGELVPMDELDPYVQDALDLIEFANGPASAGWGKVRAGMGHPEPFNMKYIGIGNEQWGPEYIRRYKVFEAAIKSRYPGIVIVSGSGPFPDGEMFDYGWAQLKELGAEIVDEHYYRNPGWFLENADRYDRYDRNGPKVFAGEYAAQSAAIASPENKNNWECALAEAAFMTGLERNAEVVYMTSYAPLFAHAEGWQWTPDLIWFNNLQSYGTPNYYVQKLFATNRGTHLLSMEESGQPVTGAHGLYATAAKDTVTGELIVKIVNVNDTARKLNITLTGAKALDGAARVTVLKSEDKDAVNSFETPEKISPVNKTEKVTGDQLNLQVDPRSLSVIRVSL